MSALASQLRTLHRLLKQKTDLLDRLARGPKQIKARENLLEKARLEQQALLDRRKQTRMQVDQKQLNLRSGEAKVADLGVKLNMASAQREYQALKDQIAAIEMANSVLSDEILEALEKLDSTETEIAASAEQVKKAEQDLEKTKAEVARVKPELDAELTRVLAELAESENGLPEDFVMEYRRVVVVRGEGTLAAVEGEACSNCCQHLTPNMLNNMMLGMALVCKSCGCILYHPEDRGKSLSRGK